MSQYKELGIDALKGEVKKAFGEVIDNEFRSAFCNIIRDPWTPGFVLTQHGDGDGSKFLQRLLHYFETRDPEVLRGAVDDALSMNTGDAASSGFVTDYIVNDFININAANAPKPVVMREFARRFGELKKFYAEHGIRIFFLGGETADLPDQVKSVVFDITVYSRLAENRLITGNVTAGDVIFGMASDGKAMWEPRLNSGIMSNGLTMARLKLMSKAYNNRYPALIREDKPFEGRFRVGDKPAILGGMTVSEAILSPTRQWAVVIKKIIDELVDRDSLNLLHGIAMNTGGGAYKIANVGTHIRYRKEMPTPSPIFHLIQSESGELWKNMFESFNCGVGIDIVGSPEGNILQEVLESVSDWSNIELFELGGCFASDKAENEVELITPYGNF
jgi:phosphoribosylformylglycinamidine cyclo-ligase